RLAAVGLGQQGDVPRLARPAQLARGEYAADHIGCFHELPAQQGIARVEADAGEDLAGGIEAHLVRRLGHLDGVAAARLPNQDGPAVAHTVDGPSQPRVQLEDGAAFAARRLLLLDVEAAFALLGVVVE